jgi:hypothetical protein
MCVFGVLGRVWPMTLTGNMPSISYCGKWFQTKEDLLFSIAHTGID